jgi:very-short-patch-repair endonuclease
MAILGKPQGIFDLSNSDYCVGSYLLKSDVKEILNVSDEDLKSVKFTNKNGNEVCDEKDIQKIWYKGEIPNAIPDGKSSLDELLLIAIIKKTYPNIIIERQSKVLRYSMDLKITLDKKEVYIEFDGPYHFIRSQYGEPKKPFIKKQIVQDKTGIEVVNWPYWIQRYSSNVKTIFEKDIKGYGALWSTEIHFGTFFFPDSAQIIETISKRFNAVDDNGYGYFYGPSTRDRNNPEHPIIEKIKNGKKNIDIILPKGYKEINYWIPQKLMK